MANYNTQLAAEIGKSSLPHGMPAAVTPFSAVNAAPVTTTTHIAVKAAVVDKRHFITGAHAVNVTAAEVQVLALEVGGVNIAVLVPDDGADANPCKKVTFNPPLPCAAGEAVYAIGLIALVGDCYVEIEGYVED